MKRIAEIKEGFVTNVLLGDVDDIKPSPGKLLVQIPENANVDIGYLYKNNTFSADIEKVKKSKLIEITTKRDLDTSTEVIAFSRPWQSDIKSRELLCQAITLANNGAPLPPVWRDANNEDMPITSVTELVDIASAIAAQVYTAYATSWERKALLKTASTVAEIGDI